MKRKLFYGVAGLLAFPVFVNAQDITLNSYTNQSEIRATGSVTLTDGFYIPAGKTVRIFTGAGFQQCVAAASLPSTDQNYVLTRVFKVPGVNSTNINDARMTCEVNQTVQYLDGLGRPLQTVTVQGSPDFRDLVQPVAYDAFGREAKKYLPYVSSLAVSNGSYKAGALSDQAVFYNDPSAQNAAGVTPIPGAAFSMTMFEPSPLNRIDQQGAPGTVWQPATGRTDLSGRTVVLEYGTNVAGEVQLWSVTSTGAATTAPYLPGKLYKNISKDENWVSGKTGTVEEFKDFEQRVVLKRIWKDESISLSTCYVYDDLGNLRYVVPPGVTAASFTEAVTDDPFNQFIYGYHYDGRRRLIEKKVPGKGWEYLVYNKLDQVVLSQDAVQKQNNKWMFSKYDAFGRMVMTGVTGSTKDRAGWQTDLDAHADNNLPLWENRDNANANTTGTGYTNLALPAHSLVEQYYTISYYDDYAFYGNSFSGPIGEEAQNVTGLQTGSKVNVLDGSITQLSTMLLSTSYYDDEGRLARTKSGNHLGGTDQVVNTWNFAAELTASTRTHIKGATTTTIASRYEYDHMGRKLATMEEINGQGEVVLGKLEYNGIGQLKDKALHSTDGSSFLQHTAYSYNERGWLKSSTSDQFSELLKYNQGSSPQYNGNISGQDWGTGSSYPNSFSYSYDKLNRLTSGVSTGVTMSEVLSYDNMGNIKTMNRDAAGTGTYNYTGNRLESITGGPLATGSYLYDAGGNATTDGRTGVALSYNLLNLPVSANKSGLSMTYTYDAIGNKLKKQSSTTGTTDYVSGIHYKTDGTIDFIQTEEGLARNNGGTYVYEYNLSDHLGNVRYSFNRHPVTGQLQQLQADNYYAFGLRKLASPGPNKYLYNGKELQEELGQYDYGARFYDPVIGRWNVVDPKAQLLEMSSPYVYALNSPSSFIDKDGELPIYIGGKTGNDSERNSKTYWDAQLLATIAGSGMPNPGHTSMFVDGNRYLYSFGDTREVRHSGLTEGQTADGRRNAGYEIGKKDFKKILSQLERDPKTRKITEKIQIYTHSRGGAFGAGYTEALLEMIKQNESEFADAVNEIDYVLNMAPHQSDAINAPKGANSFSIDHSWDMLSGDDMGNNIGFKTNTKSGSPGASHQNKTFTAEVGAFIKSFQKSKGDNNKLIDDFVKQMRSYGIKVTVN